MGLCETLRQHPIVVSVQASENSGLEDPQTLLALARCSLSNGAAVLRLQGVDTIRTVRESTGAPVIGLVKRRYEDSQVYITPTMREVDELLNTGCEAIAIDATLRPRPGGETFAQLARKVLGSGKLVLADCDTLEAVRHALEGGADIVSTTLAGYTEQSPRMAGPDLDFLRRAVEASDKPVLAEGRFVEVWQVQAAMRIGAVGVVMGGAVNDPVKQTRMFSSAVSAPDGVVGAVDIGGTWLRFAVFDPNWKLMLKERTELPGARHERLQWIRSMATHHQVSRLGVATGGTVDPQSGEVVESKPSIPENVGTVYSQESLGVPTVALNDGLASAWAHACLPKFAGKSIATLAVGTGVGCGMVRNHRMLIGRRGEYPRLNDVPFDDARTIEGALGGAAIANGSNLELARSAALRSLELIRSLWIPDHVVLCGSVGLTLAASLGSQSVIPSPFGEDAGLYGAAALALYPPNFG